MSAKAEKKVSDIIDFEPKKRITSKPLSEIVGKVIVIKDARVEKLINTEYAIIMTDNDEDYYTFSKVIVDQTKELIPSLQMGYKIRVCVTKKKRYFTFERPQFCRENQK